MFSIVLSGIDNSMNNLGSSINTLRELNGTCPWNYFIIARCCKKWSLKILRHSRPGSKAIWCDNQQLSFFPSIQTMSSASFKSLTFPSEIDSTSLRKTLSKSLSQVFCHDLTWSTTLRVSDVGFVFESPVRLRMNFAGGGRRSAAFELFVMWLQKRFCELGTSADRVL